MASGLRSLQKRILKKIGFTRQTSRIEIRNNVPVQIPFKRGEGPILGPDRNPVGQHYPTVMPAFAGKGTPKRKGPARGSRRGTTRKGYRHAGDGLPK